MILRRITSIFLLVAMFLFPLGQRAKAVANNIYEDGDFSFKIVDNVAYTWKYLGRSADVTVPDTVFGYPVEGLSACTFFGMGFLKSVTIPEGVTDIGDSSFQKCSGLTSVSLPETMTRIGKNAFTYCTSLTNITIPNSVTMICGYAFSGCYALKDVTLSTSLSFLGPSAFSHCTAMEEIVLPGSLSEIKTHTFSHCIGLRYIEIPASVYKIHENAFYELSRKQYTIITYDDTGAFHYAEKYNIRTMTPDMMATVRANNS